MLGKYLSAGNTQPGGFYDGGTTAYGGFPEPPPSGGSGRARSHELYAAPAKFAGTGQPAPFMGEATTKLYLNLVNNMVDKHSFDMHEQLSPDSSPTAAPAPGEWKITNDMMNQKWGTVLRTLQPSMTNNNNSSSSYTAQRPAQAPAFLSGKSYMAGAAPPTMSPRWAPPSSGGRQPTLSSGQPGLLSARPPRA